MPGLAVDAVCFRFGSGVEIGPLTLSLGPGLHRLSGRNGIGKSTLFRCLCGDLEPTSGRVCVDGLDPVTDVNARALIGHAPYPDDLPDFLNVDQVWRNLAAFRRCPDWQGESLARRLALPVDLPLAQASAGQRRKAGLLASLVGDPHVLLLDEPWAAVDAAAIDVIIEVIATLRSTHVVLFTCHGDCPLAVDSTHEIGDQS